MILEIGWQPIYYRIWARVITKWLRLTKTTYVKHTKGLVIFNPAVGGWSRGEGGQKYLETCFRGVEFFLHSCEGVKKFLRCLSKTFYIKCGGVKILFILHVRGVKKFSVARRGG